MLGKTTIKSLQKRIMAAQRKIPADLVITNGRLVNVFTGTVNDGDVAVYDGVVVGIGSAYHVRKEVEAQGKWHCQKH